MTKRLVTLLTAAALVLAAVFFVQRYAAEAAKANERLRIAEEQEVIAVRAYKEAHDSIPKLKARMDSLEASSYRNRQKARTAILEANAATADARAVLAAHDSLVPKEALERQVVVTDSLSEAFTRHLAQDVADSVARVKERALLYSTVTKADSALAAKDGVITALKAANRCRILGFAPCPSRTTVFIVGVTTGVLVARRQ